MRFFASFMEGFTGSLMQNGITPFKDFVNVPILDETPVLVFYKHDMSVFYIYQIINGEVLTADKIRSLGEQSSVYASELAVKNNFRMVVVTNILVNHDRTTVFNDIFGRAEEYYGQQVYNLSYNIILSERVMLAPEGQPSGMVELKSMLDAGFSALNPVAGISASETYKIPEQTAVRIEPPVKARPLIVYLIFAANIIVFALCEINGGSENIYNLIRFGAFNWNLTVSGDFYRPLTALFLHSGIWHIAANSLALYIFGERIEKYFGHVWFIAIYLLSGVISCMISGWIEPMTVMVGASGAIFGLEGAALVLAFASRKQLGGINSATLLLLTVSSLAFGFTMPNVGNLAHIIGFAAGIIIAAAIILTGRLKIERNS